MRRHSAPTTYHYAPPENTRGGLIYLPEDEARHALRVLRLGVGDALEVVDGEGGWSRCTLAAADRRTAACAIAEQRRDVGEPDLPLTVGLALLKSDHRFEMFLEKATELGVTRIVPLVTERTERTAFKAARAHQILLAAMKQSRRSRLVALAPPTPFAEFLRSAPEGLGVLCHEAAAGQDALPALLAGAAGASAVLVGPEGGFTGEEAAAAEASGWRLASLGPRRLRAETAAVAAAAAVMLWRAARLGNPAPELRP